LISQWSFKKKARFQEKKTVEVTLTRTYVCICLCVCVRALQCWWLVMKSTWKVN